MKKNVNLHILYYTAGSEIEKKTVREKGDDIMPYAQTSMLYESELDPTEIEPTEWLNRHNQLRLHAVHVYLQKCENKQKIQTRYARPYS